MKKLSEYQFGGNLVSVRVMEIPKCLSVILKNIRGFFPNGFSSVQRDEEMSRMFDEVMGLGEFADSSRGSVGSSKSGGQPESKGLDETLEQAESQPLEEDSNSSRQEKKTDEGTGETSFPPLTSSSSEKLSSFNMVRSERGGGGSGGAAFDDALDGLPSYGPEEEDEEDWHYALPMGSLEDVDVGKASKISQLGQENSASQSNPFDQKPEAEEEEQENEGSTESANTSHSSQDNTPEHDKGKGPQCILRRRLNTMPQHSLEKYINY